jgi:D-aminoacyl-tRNA deacylase
LIVNSAEYYVSAGENATLKLPSSACNGQLMIALIQRVTQARVDIGHTTASIERGILALIGIELGDDEQTAARLLERVLAYRIFPDDQGRMNLDLRQIAGGLLLVPQFTLAADTSKGNRPGFSGAATPEIAAPLFQSLVRLAQHRHPQVASGRFGAHMQVTLCNDGPVTFNLRVAPRSSES